MWLLGHSCRCELDCDWLSSYRLATGPQSRQTLKYSHSLIWFIWKWINVCICRAGESSSQAHMICGIVVLSSTCSDKQKKESRQKVLKRHIVPRSSCQRCSQELFGAFVSASTLSRVQSQLTPLTEAEKCADVIDQLFGWNGGLSLLCLCVDGNRLSVNTVSFDGW